MTVTQLLHPNVRTLIRSEEHTSELQSHLNLVCRLLLEKKKTACAGTSNVSAQKRCDMVSHCPRACVIYVPVVCAYTASVSPRSLSCFFFFFFLNDTAPPEISTLPLHAALPI